MTIELAGIELFGFHGVLEAERTQGQRFLVDLDLTVDGETATAAAASDRIEDAVDYRDVLAAVRDVSDAHAYHLLEAFASAVAAFDRGAALFRVHDVRPHVEALAAAAAVERGSVLA